MNQDKTKEEIEQIKQNIEASKATITQGWTKLSLEAKQQAINWFNAAVNHQNTTSNAQQAYAATMNAGTNSARLEFDKWLHDVKDSTKLTVETIKSIGQTLINKIPFGRKGGK